MVCRTVLVSWMLATALMLGAPSAGAAEAPELKVRVLLYSGRPDPTYTISDSAEIERLRQALQQAQPAPEFAHSTVIRSALGYKGIVVENPQGIANLPAQITVYRDNVETSAAGDAGARRRSQFRSDAQRSVETVLLELAAQRGVIPDNVLKRMRED
jgi:hypothetical protein